LNRPLRDSIIIQIPSEFPFLAQLTGDYTRAALENREELRKLENYEKISDLRIKMNQSEGFLICLLSPIMDFRGKSMFLTGIRITCRLLQF